jgi:thioredoxin reductase
MNKKPWDVIIVGGGPAGLSAAMLLGRCRRKVILFDTNKPRNRFSSEMHGFLTRDGIAPLDFLNIARKQLDNYKVNVIEEEIVSASNEGKGFTAISKSGKIYRSKKMLLATGLIDKLPSISGIEDYYGKSVFHCPYCDGWEVRDRALVAYGKGKKAIDLALGLRNWSNKVSIVTNGYALTHKSLLKRLKNNDIQVYEGKIKKLVGTEGKLKKIIFENKEFLKCNAMFFSTGFTQHSPLAEKFNCVFIKKGVVVVNKDQETSVKGLFVAGDAAKDMQMVIVAASEGVKAGVCINKALLRDELI